MPGGNGLVRRKGGRENMNELDELRLKIATEKGYTHVIGKMDAASRYPTEYWLVGNSKTSVLPDWTTDIAAAWELVEEMPRMQLNWYAKTAKYSRGKGGPLWTCRINMMNTMDFCGATAAEAISRAYLAWKEAQKP
jgi:hypothetical protein